MKKKGFYGFLCINSKMKLTQSVGGIPLEQSSEQRLGLRTQELRHS